MNLACPDSLFMVTHFSGTHSIKDLGGLLNLSSCPGTVHLAPFDLSAFKLCIGFGADICNGSIQ